MKKVIYINPGDMLEIRIIDDPELPKSSKEWAWQNRPGKILLHVISETHIDFADPQVLCTTMKHNIKLIERVC
jgi:hypothetical protein